MTSTPISVILYTFTHTHTNTPKCHQTPKCHWHFAFLTLCGLSILTASCVWIVQATLWQDVCPSVRMTHNDILSKRLYISSKFFHHRVAPSFYMVTVRHNWQYCYGFPLMEALNAGVRNTRSWAVAERPRNASCHWIFCYVTQGYSRSFEMTLLSIGHV